MNRDLYIKLNNSFKHSLTYSFENLGFYSNFNNMILTMAFCLKNRLRFRVYCKNNNIFSPVGWERLFLPMDFETKNPFFAHFNYRKTIVNNNSLNERVHDFINKLYPIITGNNLINSAFTETRTFWFHLEQFKIEELEFNGGLQELCHELINITYNFNEDIKKRILSYTQTINIPEKYISMQIRRGDKDTERKLLPISSYMDKAISSTKLRDAFILTDDYAVIEQLSKNYPCWNFYTLTTPSERGYYYNKDNVKMEELWIKLFASMEIMRKSDLFIGTISANPGMFMGMAMKKDCSIFVDSNNWIIL